MISKDLVVVGNWKSNPGTAKDAEALLRIAGKIKKYKNVTQVICPPAVFLPLGKKHKKPSFTLGAQDVGVDGVGAHTGDIAADMLADMKIGYAIVGHSERRALGETNEMVAKKAAECVAHGITPVICIGEAERDERHMYLGVVSQQLTSALAGIPRSKVAGVIIAYEPVWAIGVGAVREATPEEFREMAIYMRKIISDTYGDAAAKAIRIIYGGSSDEKTAGDFIVRGGAQGFLVGRVSIIPKRWEKMVETCGLSLSSKI